MNLSTAHTLILTSDMSREDSVSQMVTQETNVLGLRSWRNTVKDVKQNVQPTEKMHTEEGDTVLET